jgi:hypothetical protein
VKRGDVRTLALSLEDRAACYNESAWGKHSAASQLRVAGGWLIGVWQVGNDYRNRAALYGSYPPRLLDRLFSLFPDVPHDRTLHVFSGAVPKGMGLRVDINPERRPDIVGDAEHLSDFITTHGDAMFLLVVADPPYSKADAERYGTKLPHKLKVLREIAKVTAPGGFLCWLDCIIPMYARRDWTYVGQIFVTVGSNKRVRLWSIFQRTRGT